MKLWPDQFLNRKVQEHDKELIEINKRLADLEKKPVIKTRAPKQRGE